MSSIEELKNIAQLALKMPFEDSAPIVAKMAFKNAITAETFLGLLEDKERVEAERDTLTNKLANVEGQLAAVERLRPVWAQGYSTDSVAAQVSAAALTSLWDLLGVGNQTSAVVKLKQLLCVSAERDALAAKLRELEGQEPVAWRKWLMFEGGSGEWKFSAFPILSFAEPLFAHPVPAELSKWEGAEEWMPLAYHLCAEEYGEDACHELIWEGVRYLSRG